MTVGNGKAGKDSGAKPEGKEERESSAGKEVEASSGAGGTDQSVEFIIHFAKVVELYEKKNKTVLGAVALITSYMTAQKTLAQKVNLNTKEGMAKKEGWTPQKSVATQQASPDKMPWA